MAINLKKCRVCLTRYTSGKDTQHLASEWHNVAREARKLRKMGLSYSEVARQVNFPRQETWRRLREEKL